MGKTALIIVDYQNDFLPDGSLAVKDGRDCLAVFKDLLNKDEWDWDVIIASQVSPPSSSTIRSLTASHRTITRKATFPLHRLMVPSPSPREWSPMLEESKLTRPCGPITVSSGQKVQRSIEIYDTCWSHGRTSFTSFER